MPRISAKAASRHVLATTAAAAGLLLLSTTGARAQALTVFPVNILLAPGQMTSTLTVANNGDATTSIQVRAFSWDQAGGVQHLALSDQVMTSPPIATIAPGATQTVRLVLRSAPEEKEASFRILVDQIPPAAAPGTVRMALRLSIPVFAEPPIQAIAHVRYHLYADGGKLMLVAVNDGTSHDTIRAVTLTTAGGETLTTDANASPYILAGATREWNVTSPVNAVAQGASLHLTASTMTGKVSQSVIVTSTP
jgi:fimbrial chaperone protein